jgi:hypothetical protein
MRMPRQLRSHRAGGNAADIFIAMYFMAKFLGAGLEEGRRCRGRSGRQGRRGASSSDYRKPQADVKAMNAGELG